MTAVIAFVLSHWRMILTLGVAVVMLSLLEYYKHEYEDIDALYQQAVAAGRAQEAQTRAQIVQSKLNATEAQDAHIKAVSDLAVMYDAAFKRLSGNASAGGRIVPAVPGAACGSSGSGQGPGREALAAGMADAARRLLEGLDRNDQFLQRGALGIARRGDGALIDRKTCAQWAMKEYGHASEIRSTAP